MWSDIHIYQWLLHDLAFPTHAFQSTYVLCTGGNTVGIRVEMDDSEVHSRLDQRGAACSVKERVKESN